MEIFCFIILILCEGNPPVTDRPTGRLLLTAVLPITQLTIYITSITQRMFKRYWEVDKRLASLLSMGLSSHGDNALCMLQCQHQPKLRSNYAWYLPCLVYSLIIAQSKGYTGKDTLRWYHICSVHKWYGILNWAHDHPINKLRNCPETRQQNCCDWGYITDTLGHFASWLSSGLLLMLLIILMAITRRADAGKCDVTVTIAGLKWVTVTMLMGAWIRVPRMIEMRHAPIYIERN